MTDRTFKTSGTTGKPKSFTLTDAQIAARVSLLATMRPPGFADLMSIAVGRSADSASTVRYKQWIEAKRGKFIALALTLDAIADVIEQTQPDCIVGSPAFLAAIAAYKNWQWRPKMILCGGFGLSASMSRAIRARLCSNLWNTYSASEVGTISFASAAQVEAVPGCVGKPCPGVQVKIVDGVVQVKTPVMAAAYDDGTQIGEWFNTGDKGSIARDGTIILTGRV